MPGPHPPVPRLLPPRSPDAPAGLDGVPAGPRLRAVVVVDDNDRFRTGIVRAMQRYGGIAEIYEAVDGAAGLQAIRTVRPEVAVIDHRLPGLGGVDIARAVRADPRLADVQVVLLTASTEPDLARRAAEAGAWGILDKAISRREIHETVRRVGAAGAAPA